MNDVNQSLLLVSKMAKKYGEEMVMGIDSDGLYYVFITNIDRLKNKRYMKDLTGHGVTVYDACMDYILAVMDRRYNIRYRKKYYATVKLRNIIRRTDILTNFKYSRERSDYT